MEKILMHFDESNFRSALTKLRQAVSNTQKVVDQINAINSYKLDQTGFEDILQSRGESTAKRIEKALDAELIQAKISSSGIRSAAIKADVERYYTIINAFVRPENEQAQYLSLTEEGKVKILPESENALREEYSSYIQTEKGLEMYAAHKKLVKGVNEFLASSPRLRVNSLQGFMKINLSENRVELSTVDYDRWSA